MAYCLSVENFEYLKTHKMVTSQICYRKSSIDQHTFQCITSTISTRWKSSMHKHKTNLELQILKISAQLDKSFSKISFLMAKNNSFSLEGFS